MKKFFHLALMAIAFVFTMTSISADLSAQTQTPPGCPKKDNDRSPYYAGPGAAVHGARNGENIRVRMNGTISSKTATVGQRFNTTVTEPVYSSTGVVVVPVGSTIIGRVDSVQPAVKGGKPGQISVSFVQIRLPNGRTRAINGSLTDLDTDKARSDNESTASGDRMKHRKLIFIGGGGAGGAVLGGAVGGGKGALIGGLLGGGAGFLGERYTKGENAEVKSGSEFGVLLNQSVSLPRFSEATP